MNMFTYHEHHIRHKYIMINYFHDTLLNSDLETNTYHQLNLLFLTFLPFNYRSRWKTSQEGDFYTFS